MCLNALFGRCLQSLILGLTRVRRVVASQDVRSLSANTQAIAGCGNVRNLAYLLSLPLYV